MAKQTFTTGSVLTSTQMNNLQANDYNWTVDSKVASYVLVAADAGKRIEMNSASATTITVNTGLFTAGDMIYLSNIGSGVCTVTAGTATVNKSTNASLALSQYQSGLLYFVSASSSIFYPFDIGSTTGGKNFSLLGTGTLTGAATITVSGISGIDDIYVIVKGASSANQATINLRINTDTGSNYYRYGPEFTFSTAYSSANFSADGFASSSWRFAYMGSATSLVHGYAVIRGCNTSGKKMVFSSGNATAGGGNGQTAYFLGGYYDSASTISSISLFSDSGNFDAGTFEVYGAA